jgi:NADPH:quinone reductase-like Zn-dependent oxidoreductase
MRAARIHLFGPPEVIVVEDVAPPAPAQGEVLVRVAVAGVGPWDALVRSGHIGMPEPLPLTLGSDFSGVITAVGAGVTDLSEGDEVFGATNARFTGGYAELTCADATMVARKPGELSHREAGALPIVGVTALQMLVKHAHIEPGQRVLVLGAGGAVGSIAVELAEMHGAIVIGCEHPRSLGFVMGLGASQVVDPAQCVLEEQIAPVDAVIDTVGGSLQERAFKVLKPGGVMVSSVSSPDPKVARERGVRVVYVLVEVGREELEELGRLLAEGKLASPRGPMLGLSQARRAHDMLEGRVPRPPGRIVLAAEG